jgi:hypothetical protein
MGEIKGDAYKIGSSNGASAGIVGGSRSPLNVTRMIKVTRQS